MSGVVINAALPRSAVKRRPMPTLPYDEVADCIAKVGGNSRASMSKLALEFVVLTAARSSELRKATWNEIDLDEATWKVPAGPTKANREHRVPLSRRTLEVLAVAAGLSDGSELVFTSSGIDEMQVERDGSRPERAYAGPARLCACGLLVRQAPSMRFLDIPSRQHGESR